MRVCHKFMTYFFSSDYAELSDTFLLPGLRTELKRIWPYGHWASALSGILMG